MNSINRNMLLGLALVSVAATLSTAVVAQDDNRNTQPGDAQMEWKQRQRSAVATATRGDYTYILTRDGQLFKFDKNDMSLKQSASIPDWSSTYAMQDQGGRYSGGMMEGDENAQWGSREWWMRHERMNMKMQPWKVEPWRMARPVNIFTDRNDWPVTYSGNGTGLGWGFNVGNDLNWNMEGEGVDGTSGSGWAGGSSMGMDTSKNMRGASRTYRLTADDETVTVMHGNKTTKFRASDLTIIEG